MRRKATRGECCCNAAWPVDPSHPSCTGLRIDPVVTLIAEAVACHDIPMDAEVESARAASMACANPLGYAHRRPIKAEPLVTHA